MIAENNKLKEEKESLQKVLNEEMAIIEKVETKQIFGKKSKIAEANTVAKDEKIMHVVRQKDQEITQILQQKDQEIQNLRADIFSLRKAQAEFVRTEKEIIKHSTVVQGADIEELNRLRSAVASLTQEVSDFKSQTNRLTASLNEERDQKSKVITSLKNVKEEAETRLKKDIQSYEQMLERTKSELEILKVEHTKAISKMHEKFDSETSMLIKQVTNENQRTEALNKNLASVNTQLAEKSAAFNALRLELESLKLQLTDKDRTIDEIQDSLRVEMEQNTRLKELLTIKEENAVEKLAKEQLMAQTKDQQEIIRIYEKKTSEYQSEIERILNDIKRMRSQNELDLSLERQALLKKEEKIKEISNELILIKNLNQTQDGVIEDLKEKVKKLESINLDWQMRFAQEVIVENRDQFSHARRSSFNHDYRAMSSKHVQTSLTADLPLFAQNQQLDFPLHTLAFENKKPDARNIAASFRINSVPEYSISSDNQLVSAEKKRFLKPSVSDTPLDRALIDDMANEKIEEIQMVEDDTPLMNDLISPVDTSHNQNHITFMANINRQGTPLPADILLMPDFFGQTPIAQSGLNQIDEALIKQQGELQQQNLEVIKNFEEIKGKYDNLVKDFDILNRAEKEALRQNELMMQNLNELNEEIKLWKSSIDTYKNQLWEVLAKAPLRAEEISTLLNSEKSEDPVLLLKAIFELIRKKPTKTTIEESTEIDEAFKIQLVALEKQLKQKDRREMIAQTDPEHPVTKIILHKEIQVMPLAFDKSTEALSRPEFLLDQATQAEILNNQQSNAMQAKADTVEQMVQTDGKDSAASSIKFSSNRGVLRARTDALMQTEDDISIDLAEIKSGVTADELFKKKVNLDELVSPILPRLNAHRFSIVDYNSEKKFDTQSPGEIIEEDYRAMYFELSEFCNQMNDQNVKLIQAKDQYERSFKEYQNKMRKYKREIQRLKADLQAARVSNIEQSQMHQKQLSEIDQSRNTNIFHLRSGNDSLGGQNNEPPRLSTDDEAERLRIENTELKEKYKELIDSIRNKRRVLLGELKGISQLKQNFEASLLSTFGSASSMPK